MSYLTEFEDIRETEEGAKVFFRMNRTVGAWTVSFERGAIPEVLKGFWHSKNDLIGKTDRYLQNREGKNKTALKVA